MNLLNLKNIIFLLLFILMSIMLIYFIMMLNDSSNEGVSCGVVSNVPTQIISKEYEVALRGKKLFTDNCANCHNKSMIKKSTGPALAGSIERWNYDTLELKKYINDSESFRDNKVFREKRLDLPFEMMAHKNELPLESVKDIIEYINYQSQPHY